jgi:Methyltransferase domain
LDFFRGMLDNVPRPLTILDVGGTAAFWNTLGFSREGVEIVLLNVRNEPSDPPHLRSIVGDARDLTQFGDKSIDVVYSNSVIEHVGDLREQGRMADEIRRVAKRYFVQTPNKYFPIEPHFLVPGYQFMPLNLKTFLLTKSRLGWTERERDWSRAQEIAGSVRLLSEREVRRLFPEAAIYRERFSGLTKSVIAYHGW